MRAPVLLWVGFLVLALSACGTGGRRRGAAPSDGGIRPTGDGGALDGGWVNDGATRIDGRAATDGSEPVCISPSDCDDLIACTVDECLGGECSNRPDDARCEPTATCDPSGGGCIAGTTCTGPSDCADTDPCTVNERCDLARGRCVSDPLDADHDGHGPTSCGGLDCDDDDDARAPGLTELCDNIDNDCDRITDGAAANADCGSDEICVLGACDCATGFDDCSGTCRDLAGDDLNCGICGRRCLASEECFAGNCLPRDCDVGTPCTDVPGCRTGSCITEQPSTIGDGDDPIAGFPGGATTVPVTYWENGYCSPVPGVRRDDASACDPDGDPGADGCGGCASCQVLGDSGGVDVVACMQTCTPRATTRGGCRTGYQCTVNSGVCYPGCTGNDECRIYRPDTNGNGTIDPYDRVANPGGDRLTYDALTDAVCNAATARCEHSGGGGVAGDRCTRDSQCEANGRCFSDPATDGSWRGGYCTKLGCDLAGISCAGGQSVCQERRIGTSLCARGCTVAAEPMADRTGANGHGAGCRAGYACVWNGVGAAGTARNGACIPGNYNGRASNNVGSHCVDDGDCYSPYGQGLCLNNDFWRGGYCSILDCSAPGMPGNVCGSNAQCATLVDDVPACFEDCTRAEDCATGFGCYDTTAIGVDVTGPICFPGCLVTGDCRSGQRCDRPDPMTLGECI